MRRAARALAPLLFAAGCAGSDWSPAEGGTIALVTRDGITLAADYYPAEMEAAPAVVLLHMTPSGGYSRTDWPSDFISGLQAEGWSVLVPDRRGAGESEGEAEDAYVGEYGRYDVEACALQLLGDGAGPLAIVGASNGTTSMIDYADWAPGEGLPTPAALGFMTGGDYTESQTAMEALDPVPAVFTYSTAESAWSIAQMPLDPGSWRFLEYSGGDHGTRMFDVAPDVGDTIVEFLAGSL